MKRLRLVGLALGLFSGALALSSHRPAVAATATSNFTVTATVVASCTISTTAIAFGNYDPVVANATTPVDANGTVTVACTAGAATTVGMSQGANPTGTSTAAAPLRQMASGAVNRMRYDIFQDAARATVWADTGTAGAQAYNATTKNATVLSVYGRIPAGQDVSTGAYTDTVTATILF
jgi:spore coat protein U domain-containing protein, fimbrial subunit CupE1/2/3/6